MRSITWICELFYGFIIFYAFIRSSFFMWYRILGNKNQRIILLCFHRSPYLLIFLRCFSVTKAIICIIENYLFALMSKIILVICFSSFKAFTSLLWMCLLRQTMDRIHRKMIILYSLHWHLSTKFAYQLIWFEIYPMSK
jgi:hypothetical protein